jgi:hypothetical protein
MVEETVTVGEEEAKDDLKEEELKADLTNLL